MAEPAAFAAFAAAPAAQTGVTTTSTVLATAKAAMLSPVFGVAALVGLIAFEWWKGSRDAKGFASAKKADA